jgi:hypothetical protein
MILIPNRHRICVEEKIATVGGIEEHPSNADIALLYKTTGDPLLKSALHNFRINVALSVRSRIARKEK